MHIFDTDDDLLNAQKRFDRTEELLSQIKIISITPDAVDRLAQLVNSSKLRKIGRADLIIARLHFPIGLRL
jgi:hypothetical protein